MSADVRPSSQHTDPAGSGAAERAVRAILVLDADGDYVLAAAGAKAAAWVKDGSGDYVLTAPAPEGAAEGTIVAVAGDYLGY